MPGPSVTTSEQRGEQCEANVTDGVNPQWLTDSAASHADPAQVAEYYDQWAADYDHDLVTWDYRAPSRAASLFVTYAPRVERLLDAGCGTGMAAAALRHAGFDGVIDGVDVSESSRSMARERGVYDQLSYADLQRPLDIATNTYGGVVCVGVMTYVPQVQQCWSELCRVVQPGGIIVVTQREDHWRNRNCAAIVDALCADGLWDPVLTTEAEPYLPHSPGDVAELGVHYLVARVTVTKGG